MRGMTRATNDDPLERVKTAAQKVARADADRAAAKAERDAAMREARDSGATWHAIALAAGMTEKGTRAVFGLR